MQSAESAQFVAAYPPQFRRDFFIPGADISCLCIPISLRHSCLQATAYAHLFEVPVKNTTFRKIRIRSRFCRKVNHLYEGPLTCG